MSFWTFAPLLVMLASYLPAGYLAWSLNRAANALEAHNRAREPKPPADWVPAHSARALRQPTRELVTLVGGR